MPRPSRRSQDLALALAPAALLVATAAAVRADVVATGDVNSAPTAPAPGAALTGLDVGSASTGALTFDQGSTLSVANTAGIGGAAGSSGLVVVTGTGTLLSLDGGVLIGRGYTPGGSLPGQPQGAADGILRVLSGATVTAGSLHMGESWDDVNGDGTLQGRGFGTVAVDGAGSSVAIAGDISVFEGHGTIEVSGGGTVASDSLYGPSGPGGLLAIDVRGAGSSFATASGAGIGMQGPGTLEVRSGATVALGGYEDVGGQAGGAGAVLVDGAGSSLLAGGGTGNDLHIGSDPDAEGAVTVRNGALLEVVDRVNPADPTESVSDFFQHARLIVGFGGQGSLDVISGARLFVHDRGIAPKRAELFIGTTFASSPPPPFSGVLTVDGAGSTCELRGRNAFLGIGQGGDGRLVVGAGATMLVDGLDGAGVPGSASGTNCGTTPAGAPGTGSIEVAGTLRFAASLAPFADRFMNLGVAGSSGHLEVRDGGLVSARLMALGTNFANPVTAGAVPGDGDCVVFPGGALEMVGTAKNPNPGGVSFTAGINVGNVGTGRLAVASDGSRGGLLRIDGQDGTFPFLNVGNTAFGSGALSILGPGARASFLGTTGSGVLQVAVSGTGTAIVAGGGAIDGLLNLAIGRNAGSVGTMTIDGAATVVSLTRVETSGVAAGAGGVPGQGPTLLVGRGGRGSLTLSGGAQVLIHPDLPIAVSSTSAALVVGGSRVAPNGGTGDMTMTGGSLVEVGGEFGKAVVGRDGTGSLAMSGGSVLRVLNPDGQGAGLVGSNPGGRGTLTVSGAQTLFDGGASLLVGVQFDGVADGGAGTVTLDGGTVAGATVRVGTPGTIEGTGTVRGDLVLQGGLLSPSGTASAIGAISIAGGFTLLSGTARVEVAGTGAGQFDTIAASGALALQGGAVDVRAVGGYVAALGDEVRVFTGSGASVSGSVAVTGTGIPAGAAGRLVADASGILVRIVAASTPAAPGALTVTAASRTSVGLAWTDNASDETGFEVERSLSGAGSFARVGTAAANATTFTDATVAAGTAYDY
ncbi:MAG TPA: hypothetical protein VHF22_03780, partial [Planctomycetota bacterium]|nr:hypothetical protein [Planctomycetota bacterium]